MRVSTVLFCAFVGACAPKSDRDGGADEGGSDSVTEAGADEGPAMLDTGADSGAALEAGADVVAPPAARVTATHGSAMVLSADDRVAVATNRTAGSVSVFRVGFPGSITRTANLDLGATSEPWAAVLSNDGASAYVILRRDRQVVKVTGLDATPAIAPTRANTGSEPTGVAISPNGRRLYVANWAEGTVSVVTTADMAVERTVDLNPVLAGTGALGPSVTAERARPGIAHPRALVVTNDGDGDDDDETVYVTEYFSQARLAGVPADDSRFDVGRQGVVYRFAAGAGVASAAVTYLAPVADTGFQDSVPQTTGCFPNQLNAVAISNGRLYVSSVCESPRGPTGPVTSGAPPVSNGANFKTQIHAVISVVNLATNAEVEAERVLLTKRFDEAYTAAALGAADPARRMPLIVNDLQFVPGAQELYATSYGSDAVFRVRFAANGAVSDVGSAAANFIDLAADAARGSLPIGFAPSNTMRGQRALVLNENSRNVSLLDLTAQRVVSVTESHAPPAPGAATAANDGRRFFFTGLGRWSLNGQGWNSCGTCHPDGLTDNVTWFFARGPRQTSALDATFSPDGREQRVLGWTAVFDEVHDFENNTRGNSGGVGAIAHRGPDPLTPSDVVRIDGAPPGTPNATAESAVGLNGSLRAVVSAGVPGAVPGVTVRSRFADWDHIEQYVRSIRAPRAPVGLAAADVTAGRALFQQQNCAGCHGGPLWTLGRLFYVPSVANNGSMGALRTRSYTLPMGFPAGLNPPANNATRSAPLRFTALDAATIAANDQINCVLRDVGTFPSTGGAGVAPDGVVVREVRANMTTEAQGATGFNPPGLVGMATGAPYFHAGNARTLEELVSEVFLAHRRALSSGALVAFDRDATRQIVAFLLSIDDDTAPMPASGALSFDPLLCPSAL